MTAIRDEAVALATFDGAIDWNDIERAHKLFDMYPSICIKSPKIKVLHRHSNQDTRRKIETMLWRYSAT